MKKLHNSLIQRILASVLSLVMVVALFPATFAQAAEADPQQDYDAIMELYAGAPNDYDPESTENPYGHGVGKDFPLYEFQELLHFASCNLNASDNTKKLYAYWSDYANKQNGDYKNYDNSNPAKEIPIPSASYMKAVAFDPYGTGQKDCVAFVGWEGTQTHQYVMWVLNTKTGQYSNTFVLSVGGYGTPTDTAWVEEIDIPPYMMTNFLSVTAGDYDGDGKESLVAYVIADDRTGASVQPYLMQVECTKWSSGAPKLDQVDSNRIISSAFLDQNYLKVQELYQNGKPENKLGADLVSGDFNGDGYDDLACLTYFNNLNNYFNKYKTSDFGKAQLSVGFGGSGEKIDTMQVQSSYLSGVNTGEFKDEYATVSMTAASLDAGDINNDGSPELVVAGYAQLLKRDDMAMNKAHIVLGTYSLQDGTIQQTSFGEHESGGFSKWAVNANEAAMSQVQVNCVAFNGFGKAEQVLVNGTVYDFTGTGFRKGDGKTLDIFTTYAEGEPRFYIPSVAVGVFDGNTEGKESVYFTFGDKRTDGYGPQRDDYIFWRAYYKDGGMQDFTEVSGTDEDDYRGDNLEEVLNNILVTIDRDNDVIKANYVKKEYVWSDPKVVAVLQAAPYYSELGSYGDFDSGETTFSYSQIYGQGTTMEQSKSVGWGMAVEGSLAAGLKTSLEAGKTSGWSQSFEESVEKSYTSSFTATAQNSVVLSRTPVVVYQYDLNYDGADEKDSFAVSVPLAPLNTQISVDAYNNFVQVYNEHAEGNHRKLNPLTQSYLFDNEGNPWKYQNSWGSDGVSFSKSGNVLGTDGGAAGVEYAESSSVTNGTTTSEGFHFGMSAQAGFGVLAEFWAGVYGEFDSETAIGSYTTNAVERGCSGSVANIDSNGLNADYGIPIPTAKAYSFIWTFGKWNWTSDQPENDADATVVPILGYVLTNLSTPIAPVTVTSVDYLEAENQFRFTWEPSERENAAVYAGYRLYQLKRGEYELLTDELIPPENTEYALAVDSTDTLMTFVMTAVGENGTESVWSNEVVYLKGAEGKSAYEIAVENGFEGTEEEWLASLVGEKGENGVGVEKIELTATHDNMDTYTIYFTDGSTTTFTVKNGTDGEDGADGQDGREIELRVVEGTIQWKYDDEDESAWRNLLTIDGSNVTIEGTDGEDGEDGREIELRKDDETGYVQWHYVGDPQWTNLMPLSELKGEDARDVEFKIEDGNLMWRYVTQYSEWWTLGTPEELLPDADATKELEYRMDGGYIQWRYADESSEWASFKSLEELAGKADSVIELTVSEENSLQWREIIEDEWKVLGIASDLRGEDGADGREIVLRADTESGYLQWQYVGDEGWTNLIPIDDLQGVQGEKGDQGEAGRGIVSIEKTSTDGLVDTYTIIYTDGTSDTFTVTNGEKGEQGAQGIPGEKGEQGVPGEKGDPGRDGQDGVDGKDGQNGLDGQDGRDGIDGKDGKDGMDGQDGRDGIDGKNGKDGMNGQDGRNGIDGADGQNGVDGKDGAAGVGISDIHIDENGDLLFTMTDGNVINAGSYEDAVPASTIHQEQPTVKGITILWSISVLSLLWNVILTAVLLMKSKKGVFVRK